MQVFDLRLVNSGRYFSDFHFSLHPKKTQYINKIYNRYDAIKIDGYTFSFLSDVE